MAQGPRSRKTAPDPHSLSEHLAKETEDRLQAECARLREDLEVARVEAREAWDALRMIRSAVEELAPAGAMQPSEAVGPLAHEEATEIIRGIRAMVDRG